MISTPNTTKNGPGRLANQFFRNMMAHILAKRSDLPFEYGYYDKMCKLGIVPFTNGKTVYPKENFVLVNDSNFFNMVLETEITPLTTNIQLEHDACYAQTKDFALYLRDYFEKEGMFAQFRETNPSSFLCKKNTFLFLHVRLGDVAHQNAGFDYYDAILLTMAGKYQCAYIASDSIDHYICKQLIEKYGLIPLYLDEVDTILFASTCKYLVLSHGTYSWLMGFLSFAYPDNETVVYIPPEISRWHGDIFVFPEWRQGLGDSSLVLEN